MNQILLQGLEQQGFGAQILLSPNLTQRVRAEAPMSGTHSQQCGMVLVSCAHLGLAPAGADHEVIAPEHDGVDLDGGADGAATGDDERSALGGAGAPGVQFTVCPVYNDGTPLVPQRAVLWWNEPVP